MYANSDRFDTSSPPERPALDNIRNHPWSEATCLCNTASSTLSCDGLIKTCLFQQKVCDEAEVSTYLWCIGVLDARVHARGKCRVISVKHLNFLRCMHILATHGQAGGFRDGIMQSVAGK